MSENPQKSVIIRKKHGIPVYSANPSVPAPSQISRSKRVRIGDEQKGLLVDGGTGEVLGRGAAMYYEWEDVDSERFVKLYLAGLKQASGLSKAGLSVFEIVYHSMRENPGRDTVLLSQSASPHVKPVTFRRGLRELLEKEFLYRSPYDGTFFVNIRFMFNGDRLAFVRGYKLKTEAAGRHDLPS